MSQASSKRRIAAFTTVMGTIFASALFFVSCSRGPAEPKHEGKPLSAWLNQLSAESEAKRDEAQRAIRAMGADSIPVLLAGLRAPGAAGAQRGTASEQQAQAISAFQTLGKAAAPAVPELIAMMQQDADLAPIAELALVGIGEPAVAPLNEALKVESDRLRVHAAGALWSLKAEAQVVLPPLLKGLKAKEDDVRSYAAVYLAGINQAAEQVVPALIENLNDAKPAVRAATCQGLAKLGKSAKAAVPALEKLVANDADETVRSEAKNALKKVAR